MANNLSTLETTLKKRSINLVYDISLNVSKTKRLFSYQKEALENTQKVLKLYFKDYSANKSLFFKELYQENLNLDILVKDLKLDRFTLNEFFNIKLKNHKEVILFEEIVNRVSFWMATGSGKSIVIVKLIEMLFDLIEFNIIPKKEVMFLTYREDLLNSFIELIKEYNSNQPLDKKIEIISLKDYEEAINLSSNQRRVFIYRSDLIADEKKESILNFRDYLSTNGSKESGNWYLILDEAHKGLRDSKRQTYFSILAQNGFLFNFSATFIDLIDKATTIYNLNLNEFIKQGYGKEIYLLQEEIKDAFNSKRDFTSLEKEKIVLKNFILLAALKLAYKDLKESFYHNPMIIFLMNSINIDNSDLLLIFKEISKISKSFDKELFFSIKDALINELKEATCLIKDSKLIPIVKFLETLEIKDIYKYLFNSNREGNIEIIKPKNSNELLLKLDSSNKPFGLIKIANSNEFLKKHLSKEFKIQNDLTNKEYFLDLNNSNSPINILLGSRAFYEGWDSNRPNIITFINIGVGDEAKKFVLQAIGRGIRVEPIRGHKKRLNYLKDYPKELDNYKDNVKSLEKLFIFATNKKAINTILEELQSLKSHSLKESKKNISKSKSQNKIKINPKDLEILELYLKCMPIESFLLKYSISIVEYNKLKRFIASKELFILDKTIEYPSTELLIKNILESLKV